MADVTIYETHDGGDVARIGGDLDLVVSLYNQPYLALFGGNYEQLTPSDESDLENSIERFDWYGNTIFFPDRPELQFNSRTERELDNVSLTPEGLQRIQRAAELDLEYLSELAEVNVEVTLTDVDQVKIAIQLIEPDGLNERLFIFLWDGTRVQEIINQVDVAGLVPVLWMFDLGELSDNGIWVDSQQWID